MDEAADPGLVVERIETGQAHIVQGGEHDVVVDVWIARIEGSSSGSTIEVARSSKPAPLTVPTVERAKLR